MTTTGISGTPSVPSALSNLNLSQTQQQQIGQIVQNEENGTISFQQAKSQVEGDLTPQQQSQLRSEHHGGHHGHRSKQSGTQAISDIAASFFASAQDTTSTDDPAASYFGQSQGTNGDGPT